MRKKIIGYNFYTFFFSLIHIILSILFFRKDFLFILKTYIFLLPFSSFLFFICLFASINKSKRTTCIYVLCGIIKLFFGIFIFIILMIEYDDFSNFFLLRIFCNFVLSYFMILFFRTLFLST
ncbi:hypothetical protein BLBBGE_065 [Blattabacterium sp. (Blattella germanica) str. Bge]|nr:hypothetical protein BLBBGE_065 [Blattabacterium sp. (Blattella germanica) str. Bge]